MRRKVAALSTTFLSGVALISAEAQAQNNSAAAPAGEVGQGQDRLEGTDSAAPEPEADSGAEGVGDIIVTARRREERLQDVPVSVTAMDSDQLAARGVQDIQEVGRFIPNVTLADTGRTNDTRVFIRGVGGGDSNASSVQSGVGIYIDGSYMPRSVAGYLSTLDVERIEVLRGPQGTLFGKNTTGGAINVITRKPGPDPEGEIMVRIGNYNQFDVRASMNMPIVQDRLFARLTGAFETRDGFYKELTTGDTYDDNKLRAVRLALRWLPTDTLTVDFAADYNHEPESSQAGTCIWNGPGRLQTDLQAHNGMVFRDLCNGDPKDREFASDIKGFSDSKIWGLNATAVWDSPGPALFFDNLQLKLLTAWRGQKQTFLQDQEFTVAPIEARGRTPVEQEQRTVEFQLNGSAFDGRLQLVSGLYWADDVAVEGGNDCRDELASIDLAAGEEAICNQAQGFLFTTLAGAAAPNNSYGTLMANIDSRIETKAFYANTSFDVTDWLNLTAGIRHTWETRDFKRLDISGVQPNGNGWTAILNADTISINEGDEETWKAWTPMASVRVKLPQVGPIADANLYFTWATGFQSGGFNTEFPRAFLGEFFTYEPEKVDSYELGLKSLLFDRKLLLNLAGFISKYRNRQESISVENEGQFPSLDPSLSLIANAATVDIRGFEWEMLARPVDRLGITFSGGYIKARYGEFFSFDPNQGQYVDISNRRIQNLTPKWQANWSVDYRFDLAGGSTLTPMIAGFYRSGYEFRANTFLGDPPSPIYQEKFTKWDARLTWLSANERLRIALWAKNVFDKDTIGTGSVISAGIRGWTIVQLEAPRTFGIEGSLRF